MENDLPLSGKVTRSNIRERYITAFSAVKQQYGLQIKVAGCVALKPAQSRSGNVIGVVELNDQIVPILDSRSNAFGAIDDLCCIVLFEHMIGQTTIITGRLYESACQVFDLIVECMDNPQSKDRLYMHTSRPLASEAAERQ